MRGMRAPLRHQKDPARGVRGDPQLRYRLFPLTAGLILLAATIVVFIAGTTYSALVFGAFLLATWAMLGRPFFRSRYRKSLRKNVPTWNIKAD